MLNVLGNIIIDKKGLVKILTDILESCFEEKELIPIYEALTKQNSHYQQNQTREDGRESYSV